MDLENANELLKNLLFPGGKFDPKGYQQLAELGIVSEREAADSVLQAPTKSTADRIRENTEAQAANEPFVIRSNQRKIGAADELERIGTRGFTDQIGAVQAANRENLGMAYGDLKDSRQTMSGDYNKYMDMYFADRDKTRQTQGSKQTLELIKSLALGGLILAN
tara:strand:- start:10486 stop:10977 length:492 start_codon:yes stop_codon:yes gene_type:complete